MKVGKLFWWILGILVVLLIIAALVNQSNKSKITAALANKPVGDANQVGRFIASAVALGSTNFSQIFNGKAVWLWVGKGMVQPGYSKVISGTNAGWSILNEYLHSGNRVVTCLKKAASPGHPCLVWKDENGDTVSSS